LLFVTVIIQGVRNVVCGEVIGDAGGVKMHLMQLFLLYFVCSI